MNEDLATYLTLAPEFGGTRFGPFEGMEIVLGSEPNRCDIVLPESLGVMSAHVKILRQPDMSMILAPVERTATVFLRKATARRATQINTPTAVVAGDSFSLVTEDGPRFIIEIAELPPEVKAQRIEKKSLRKKRLSAAAFGAEAKRQAWTKVLVTGPGQFFQRAWTFIKSGAIYQPRYIFLGLAIVGGWIFGGAMSCRGTKSRALLKANQVTLENCKKDLNIAETMGQGDTADFTELAGTITGSTQLIRTLKEDDGLKKAVKEAAKTILNSSTAYDWLILAKDARASRFAKWREKLQAEDSLDAEFILFAPYIGADANNPRADWNFMEDSFAKETCTRGTARMTFRQALHLGLTVQADALATGSLGDYQSSKEKREAVLLDTLKNAGFADFPQNFTSTVEPFGKNQGGCVFIEGEDDRITDDKVIKAMVEHLGEKGKGLPTPDASAAAPSRIAKFFAADIPKMDFRDEDIFIDFAQFPTSTALGQLETPGQWTLKRTAMVMARAIVLPCEAKLRNPTKEAEQVFGKLPSEVPCLVLDYRLRHE